PARIALGRIVPDKGSVVRMLGVKEPVRWGRSEAGAILTVPAGAVADPPCRDAWVFKIKPAGARKGGRP
ncbi:MAG: hypothetical protein WCC00_10850, partial [Candidatus Aminicenantales bacterium]